MLTKLALAALSCASTALALATPAPSNDASVVRRTTTAPSAGRVVIYTDDYLSSRSNGLPTADDLAGYNVLILSFLLVKGAADQCDAWKQLSSSERTSLKNSYNEAGITLMASAFGSTDTPTTDGVDATSQAKTHAAWIKQYGLQGIDVDYEDMSAMNKQNNGAENWLIEYTNELRNQLPAGQYVITHAPVAPWFSQSAYKTGAYYTVNKKAGSNIDWYNVQFYNQGDTQYTTCETLITKSGGDFPGTSVKEINSEANVPFNKIVIGKPSASYQAENGYVDFSTLATCITDAGKMGWDAGTMFWEFETSKMSSITGLTKALAAIIGNGAGIPVGNTTTTTTSAASTATTTGKTTATSTSTSAPAATTTSTSTGGLCDGVKAWNKDTVYDGGSDVDPSNVSYVTYNGKVWRNRWWTQNEEPAPSDWNNPWGEVKCPSSKRADEPAQLEARDPVVNVSASHRASRHNNKMRKVHVRPNELS